MIRVVPNHRCIHMYKILFRQSLQAVDNLLHNVEQLYRTSAAGLRMHVARMANFLLLKPLPVMSVIKDM